MRPAHDGELSAVLRSALSTCCSATLMPASTTKRYDTRASLGSAAIHGRANAGDEWAEPAGGMDLGRAHAFTLERPSHTSNANFRGDSSIELMHAGRQPAPHHRRGRPQRIGDRGSQ